ncbi:MAG: recombinase RecA [Leptospiraceae bacterium]|nr:recombinase RecA [Leptospiraceae bacterium]
MKKSKTEKQELLNTENSEDKKRAIEAAMSQIEKQFGKGSIMKLGGQSDTPSQPVIPTGSLDLDIALGIGGLPIGRVVEIFGPESSGKTTLMLSSIAQAQKKGGVAAFIDAEHALDPSYAKKLGVNIDELLVSQPDNGEEALEICESLVRSNAIDIIVIDSVAALVPRAEIEGDMGDSHMGLQARLMSQALRKLTGTISKSKTIVVFINQIRMKIGVMFGSPETTTGGNALKFYASVRLDIRKIETLKDKDEPIGNRVRVKVVKNKCAPPFRQAEFDIMYNSGINKESSIIDLGVKHDLITKAGTWYSYKTEKIGQGKEAARNFLLQNPDIAKTLEAQIRDLNDLNGKNDVLNGAEPEEEKKETNSSKSGTNGKASKGKKNSYLEDELEEAATV